MSATKNSYLSLLLLVSFSVFCQEAKHEQLWTLDTIQEYIASGRLDEVPEKYKEGVVRRSKEWRVESKKVIPIGLWANKHKVPENYIPKVVQIAKKKNCDFDEALIFFVEKQKDKNDTGSEILQAVLESGYHVREAVVQSTGFLFRELNAQDINNNIKKHASAATAVFAYLLVKKKVPNQIVMENGILKLTTHQLAEYGIESTRVAWIDGKKKVVPRLGKKVTKDMLFQALEHQIEKGRIRAPGCVRKRKKAHFLFKFARALGLHRIGVHYVVNKVAKKVRT